MQGDLDYKMEKRSTWNVCTCVFVRTVTSLYVQLHNRMVSGLPTIRPESAEPFNQHNVALEAVALPVEHGVAVVGNIQTGSPGPGIPGKRGNAGDAAVGRAK